MKTILFHNYDVIIKSILSGAIDSLTLIMKYKYEARPNGDFEHSDVDFIFSGVTISDCEKAMGILVSDCKPSKDEKYEFVACRFFVNANEFEEFDADCEDAESLIMDNLLSKVKHDSDWLEINEGDWCNQTVAYQYERLVDSIVLYWQWDTHVGYARKPIRFEYCIDSNLTTQSCIEKDSTSATQLNQLVTANEIKGCATATELAELVQKRFDNIGNWKKHLDAELFIRELYEDSERFGSLYKLPKNDLCHKTIEITNLDDLAEYINTCEDYPVKAVEETITANGWKDISSNSDYDVCSDGTNKLVLDENTAEAKVVSLPTIKNTIGDKVSELRTAKGLTQQQLADAAGTTRFSIVRLEGGTYNVSIEILDKILRALDAELTITEKAAR